MRTDVKIGLFLGIAALLLAGWFYWPVPSTRPVPVGETGRPVTVTMGTERTGSARLAPKVEPLTLPAVHPEATASHAPAPVVVPPAPAVPPAPIAAPPAPVAAVPPAPSMLPSVDTSTPVTPAPPVGTESASLTPGTSAPAPSVSAEVAGPAVVGREPLLHIVKSGQTLEQIAEEYYKDGDKPYDQAAMVSLLRQANPQLATGKRLRAGTKMKIPDPASLPIAQSAPSSPTSAGHSTSPSAGGTTQAPVAASLATMVQPVCAMPSPTTQSATVPSAGGREYKVQRGDTLYSIASRQLGSPKRWHEVLDLNSTTLGGRPEGLRPGQVLRLPG